MTRKAEENMARIGEAPSLLWCSRLQPGSSVPGCENCREKTPKLTRSASSILGDKLDELISSWCTGPCLTRHSPPTRARASLQRGSSEARLVLWSTVAAQVLG